MCVIVANRCMVPPPIAYTTVSNVNATEGGNATFTCTEGRVFKAYPGGERSPTRQIVCGGPDVGWQVDLTYHRCIGECSYFLLFLCCYLYLIYIDEKHCGYSNHVGQA